MPPLPRNQLSRTFLLALTFLGGRVVVDFFKTLMTRPSDLMSLYGLEGSSENLIFDDMFGIAFMALSSAEATGGAFKIPSGRKSGNPSVARSS